MRPKLPRVIDSVDEKYSTVQEMDFNNHTTILKTKVFQHLNMQIKTNRAIKNPND
jgi:hypothetical protein